MNDMFNEVNEKTLRDCRTDTFCIDLKGQVLRCRYCLEKSLPDNQNSVSTDELSNMVFESMIHASCPETDFMNESRVAIPFSGERCDLMTYKYPLDDLYSSLGFFSGDETSCCNKKNE